MNKITKNNGRLNIDVGKIPENEIYTTATYHRIEEARRKNMDFYGKLCARAI